MMQRIWISFDLGLRGDYEGLYAWLDKHEAKECGDSLAYLDFEYEDDLIRSLIEDIKSSVEVTKKTRVYVIWQDPENRKVEGRFILGARKAPAWTGCGEGSAEAEPDEG